MKCVYQLGVAVIICVLMCFAIFDAQGEAAPDRQNEVVAEASPAVLLMERLQAAAKDAQASDAGKRAAAVVVLRKIAADIAASPVMRHEALFRIAQVSKLGEATDLVVRAFKQSDRNLARANAFLRYLRHGVDGVDGKAGTEDDLADPLAALPIISRDDARNLVYSAALARQTDDWVGLLARARLLAYMDRSLEAFDTMTQAFARCPPQEKLLQPVVDELATLVMRVTRDEGLGRQVVDYIMYGAHGEDGKAGTEDDSGDVFAMVAKRLAITQEVSNHGQIGQ